MNNVDKYLPKVHDYLQTNDLDILERPFGYTILRKNRLQLPITIDKITINDLDLELKDRVFIDLVLLLQRSTGIRSHEEERQEIVENIGDTLIEYHSADENGFYHGFTVDKEGLLYVAKVVFPDFIEGNFFRIPANTYDPTLPLRPSKILASGMTIYSVNCTKSQ